MGAIAEGIVAYAQPLLNATDGSHEQMERAFTISQLCFNLALSPEESRAKSLSKLQPSLGMDDAEFEDFKREVVGPMILRHQERFPLMHRRISSRGFDSGLPESGSNTRAMQAREAYPGTDRYAPCPCNSGCKYKFCCGAKSR